MTTARDEPQVVVLGDGSGARRRWGDRHATTTERTALTSTELYDPATIAGRPGSDLLEPRYGGHAVLLADGSVLLLGGANDFNTEGEAPWCPTPLVTTERLDGCDAVGPTCDAPSPSPRPDRRLSVHPSGCILRSNRMAAQRRG